MHDSVFRLFLEAQLAAGRALAAASDVLVLRPADSHPPQHYIAELSCTGLIYEAGAVKPHNFFVLGIFFPDDYLRRLDARAVVTVLMPNNTWHPNLRGPALCIGFMRSGSGLVDIILQAAEIITFKKFNLRDPLNNEACRWTRNNLDKLPIDPRPLITPRRASRQPCDSPGGNR